ncbi:class II histone deacetylase [Natrarchaeobius chitinivorans]|uniref:Class II histone deacetylase n=1 Tax=Natrarchaeobius chitinivorans TaxID=1679083 RepID=A0A3N6MW19_NATCH|nr:class II histone deacetylase [Natrarchaeobius chitinivorans]RQG89652.1 class II histone deacetylase [Natrarchaeobius chitinivorans]
MTSERTLSVHWDELFLTHRMSNGTYEFPAREWLAIDEPHPERPERLLNIKSAIDRWLPERTEYRSVQPATEAQLTAVHDPAYLEEIRNASRRGGERVTASTEVTESAYRASAAAAGAAAAAATETLEDDDVVPYAMSRPPGHHAQPGMADGYCFINSVAVAAEHALDTGRADSVAIIDWDVHHGNGTQECFYDRDDVLVINLHNDFGAWGPNHPQTGDVDERGEGDGTGYNVNVPLPPGTGDGGYEYAYDRLIEPIVSAFDPDLLLASAGQDAGVADPGGRNLVTKDGYRSIAARTRALADDHADGSLAIVQEGGYQLSHLAFATLGVLEGALGVETEATDPFGVLEENEELAAEWIDTAAAACEDHWDLP